MITKIVYVKQRRICWPDPDATCLEGGCLYCEGHPFRNFGVITAWARKAGQVPNRYGGKTKDAMAAWNYGLRHDFFKPDNVREVPKRVEVD